MKNNVKNFVWASLCVLLTCAAGSCNNQQSAKGESGENEETMRITVEHYMNVCMGMDVQWCLIYQKEGESERHSSYTDIKGFDYQWGNRYTLEVESVTEEDPPMDSPGGYLLLHKVIEQEPVAAGTTFELVLMQPGGFLPIEKEGDHLNLMGVTITTGLSESELQPLFEGSSSTIKGVFKHSDQKNEILLLNLKTE